MDGVYACLYIHYNFIIFYFMPLGGMSLQLNYVEFVPNNTTIKCKKYKTIKLNI